MAEAIQILFSMWALVGSTYDGETGALISSGEGSIWGDISRPIVEYVE